MSDYDSNFLKRSISAYFVCCLSRHVLNNNYNLLISDCKNLNICSEKRIESNFTKMRNKRKCK